MPFPFSRATISTDTISCGKICPTRPARCCNIGRGIFFALQIGSQQNVAIPLHHFAELFLCIFLLFASFPLLVSADRHIAFPSLVSAVTRFIAVAPRGISLPRHAVARQRCSRRSHSVATHLCTIPSRVTRFPPSGIGPCRCFATDQCRRSAHSPATRAQRRCGRRTGIPP